MALSVSSVEPRVDERASPKPQPDKRVCAAFSEPSLCRARRNVSRQRRRTSGWRKAERGRPRNVKGSSMAAPMVAWARYPPAWNSFYRAYPLISTQLRTEVVEEAAALVEDLVREHGLPFH